MPITVVLGTKNRFPTRQMSNHECENATSVLQVTLPPASSICGDDLEPRTDPLRRPTAPLDDVRSDHHSPLGNRSLSAVGASSGTGHEAVGQRSNLEDGSVGSTEAVEHHRATDTRAILGADVVLRSLEHVGVEVCFGMPGGAVLPIYDAMARGTSIRHVLARHEQGAGHMAQGYARASGRPGVALATSGPGATNLVTPIADAYMDSTPLVCITGQVRWSSLGTDAFQECDITGITMPIVKHSWLVTAVDDLPGIIRAAVELATSDRPGPVLIDIPKDIQEEPFRASSSPADRPTRGVVIDDTLLRQGSRRAGRSNGACRLCRRRCAGSSA